jgi:transposase-like protein
LITKNNQMLQKLFTGMSIYEFQAQFGDDNSCIDALSKMKWKDGYSCRYCSHKNYCNTKRYGERRCTSCKKPESATAHTLFHKLKFPPHKAFMMLYLIVTTKNGISALELHRKLGLHKRTCHYFKRKVMAAMASHCTYKMEGDIEVDETYWGGKEEAKPGRSKGKKKLIVVGIQKAKRGIKRIYLKEIQNAGVKQLRPFFDDHIDKEAKITTDKWRSYKSLQKNYPNLIQIPSRGGKNFDRLHRLISSFKAWVRGIHHSVRDLQPYLDEFTYRFNRNQIGGNIFNAILSRMANYPAVTYSQIFSVT